MREQQSGQREGGQSQVGEAKDGLRWGVGAQVWVRLVGLVLGCDLGTWDKGKNQGIVGKV